jgi:hypothetical protein
MATNWVDCEKGPAAGAKPSVPVAAKVVQGVVPPTAVLGSATPDYVRNGFIKKVYALLVCMLVLTTAIAAPFQVMSASFMEANRAFLTGLLIGTLVLTLGMSCCCMGAMKSFPANYIMLLVFSVCYGVVTGIVSSAYTLPSVLLAAGMTAGIFLVLTLYAVFTKTDFTGLGPYLFVALVGLILFGLVSWVLGIFFPGIVSVTQTVYAAIGAVLFSFFIVYDTQMIVGGRHKKCELSIDDFAFAALMLYLDIINLFLYFLALFGDRS